ncbi:unnamed protein product [Ectocarpus sp. CCAP 1310/34]|nr:unnamed protein product [Ectocarpus sp. CCAP 1310/34]
MNVLKHTRDVRLLHSYKLSRNKGRWTKDEHERFLSVAGQLGKTTESWKWISKFVVTTRSPAQVRTHAQKYFQRIGQGRPFPDENEEEKRKEDQEDDRSTAAGEAPPPQIMATPDDARCHSPPSSGLMAVVKVPSVVSLINSYDDCGGFPQAGGIPALPPSLCSPCGLFPGFTPEQGWQDSSLDPHVAAASAETAAGAAALGHDLDRGMFLPSGGSGEGSSAPPPLPPLWSGIGDASGASCCGSLSMPYDGSSGSPLDNWYGKRWGCGVLTVEFMQLFHVITFACAMHPLSCFNVSRCCSWSVEVG